MSELQIHPRFRTKAVVKLLTKIETLLTEAMEDGLKLYQEHSETYLSINVKDYRTDLQQPPEIREDKQQTLYDNRQNDFWQWDFDGDCVACTNTYHFPKIYSEGRNGGHLCFEKGTLECWEALIKAMIYEEKGRNGQQRGLEELIVGDEVGEYSWNGYRRYRWEEPNTAEINAVKNEIDGFLDGLFTAMHDVREWVRHVKLIMADAIRDVTGQNWEHLNGIAEAGTYDMFDFAHCAAVFNGDKVTVSWPQHARQWHDYNRKFVRCLKTHNDAYPIYDWNEHNRATKIKYWHRLVPSKKMHTFSFTMSLQDFIEAMEPGIVVARKALTKKD